MRTGFQGRGPVAKSPVVSVDRVTTLLPPLVATGAAVAPLGGFGAARWGYLGQTVPA